MKSSITRRSISQLAILIAAGLLLAGCKQQNSGNRGLGDSALLSHNADSTLGDSALAARTTTDYKLDDARYRQWTAAQQRLDSLGPIDAPVRLTSLDPSPADIDRTVAFLESRPDTRNALAASGLSARDYVLTTLALARANATSVDTGETDNERFLSHHRTDFDEVVSRSRFRVVDYDGRDRGKGKGGKGHDHGKHKGHGHGKH